AAIITQTAIALVLALSGSFVQLAMLSIIARMSTYVGTAAAVPFLRKKYENTKNEGIQLPGGHIIPIAALVICAVLLASTTKANLIAGAIALAIGGVIYYFRDEEVDNKASRR